MKKFKSIIKLALVFIILILIVKTVTKNIKDVFISKSIATSSDIENSIVIDENRLHSKNVLILDPASGEVLYAKNAENRIYPASMTKIMTVLLGAENLNLSESSRVEHDTVSDMFQNKASMAGFKGGEMVKNIDLLYGSILPSGGEASITIANEVSGNEDNFAQLMNETTQLIGMKNTNFKNATGLHDNNHYTSVYDMGRLLEYALKNETFKDIFTKTEYTAENGLYMESTLTKKESIQTNNGEILGGKTGYTQEAGLTLAALVDVNGREYIIVVAKNDGNLFTEQYNIIDVKTIMEYL